jgi:hypothetical protein
MKNLLLLIFTTILIFSCSPSLKNNLYSDNTTLTERSGLRTFGYVPIDPMPVIVDTYDGNFEPVNSDYLSALPDETILVATGKYNSNGTITFGPIGGTIKGEKYTVILDWIKYTTISKDIVEYKDSLNTNKIEFIDYIRELTDNDEGYVPNTEYHSIPIYTGVGLRLKATFVADSNDLNVNGVFGVSGSFNSKNVKGNLIIQSMGISGKSVSLPLPSDINQTSIQNAMMAISSIRALVYTSEKDDLQITPRIIGYYNTLGEKTNRHKMVSALSQSGQEIDFKFKLPLEKQVELYEKKWIMEQKMNQIEEKYKPKN